MLKSIGTELKVGIFAIVALTTLGYMFFVLQPDMFQSKEYARYYTVLSNAAGIVGKTQVKTAGVTIGKVRAVALENGHTKVEIEADRTVPIPVGSKIEIRSVGLLGDKHLEIVRPQEDTGKAIEPGGFIPQSTDGMDMENLIQLVGDIAKDVKKVTKTLADTLGTPRGEQQVKNIVDNIEGITSDVKATTATLKHVLGDRAGDLNDVVTNVRDGVRDLRVSAHQIRDILSDDNKERVNRILASFDETMGQAKGAAKNINLISEKIEKGDGTIGKLVNDDSTITELEGAIKDIRKVLAPATKLEVDFDSHVEAHADKGSQSYVNLLFRTRPDRYYLLGFTDAKAETVEHTFDTAPTTNGTGSTHYKETIVDKKQIRFNAQVAKRWYFVAARMGLFETTGGFAADMYFLGDNLRFTNEVFDIDTQDKAIRRNAHLKTYASVLFYNHVYAMAGFDDPSRTDPATLKARKLDKSTFLGAGMTFSDDDLKAIFGTAALVAPR